MLATGTGRPVGIHPQVLVLDLDLDIVVDHRIDPGAGKAGVAARRTVIGRNPDQPVDTGFGLQPAIGVVTLDPHGNGFHAGFLAGAFFDHFQLETAALAPAAVHADQHRCPVLGLGSAGACMDLEETVIAVRLARQQALELPLLGDGHQ